MNKIFDEVFRKIVKISKNSSNSSFILIKDDKYQAVVYRAQKQIKLKDCINFIKDKDLILSGFDGLQEFISSNGLSFFKIKEKIYSFDTINFPEKQKILVASVKKGDNNIFFTNNINEEDKIKKNEYLLTFDIIVD